MEKGNDVSAYEIDPSTLRKAEIIKDKLIFRDNFPLFSIVEFNIFGSCNRSCSFLSGF